MSELTAEQKTMLKTILAKRAASAQLTDKEERFARKMFDQLISSKQTMSKVVKFVMGDDLRKSSVDAKAARTGGEHDSQVSGIEDDKPAAKPDTSVRGAEKLPDVDEKPKHVTTENERLADILQVGEMVSKVADSRTYSGTVMGLTKNGETAIVKWEDGRQTYESATTLKRGVPEAKPAQPKARDWAVPTNLKKAVDALAKEKGNVEALVGWAEGKSVEEIAEHLKDKEDIDDPFATAQWLHQQAGGEKATDTGDVKKDGDIVGHPDFPANQPVPASLASAQTPFEGLTNSLRCVLDLGRSLKEYRETAGDDEDVCEYYDAILVHVRAMAESLLAALSMELDEAKAETERE